MKHELDRFKILKVNHSELAVIEEKSKNIEEQERKFEELTDLASTQEDLQTTYGKITKLHAQLEGQHYKKNPIFWQPFTGDQAASNVFDPYWRLGRQKYSKAARKMGPKITLNNTGDLAASTVKFKKKSIYWRLSCQYCQCFHYWQPSRQEW